MLGRTPSKRKQAHPKRMNVALAPPSPTATQQSFALSPTAVKDAGKLAPRSIIPAPTKYVVDREWRTQGSRYLFRWVVRSVAGVDGSVNAQLGFVAGWLSAKESEFVNAKGKPAGLYRAVYVGSELDGDTEDLELHETTAALWAHSCNGCHCFAADKQALDRHKATCDASRAADAAEAALEREAREKRKAEVLGGADGATTRRVTSVSVMMPCSAPSGPTTSAQSERREAMRRAAATTEAVGATMTAGRGRRRDTGRSPGFSTRCFRNSCCIYSF